MNPRFKLAATAGLALLVTACAVAPTAPSLAAMPGTGKDFEQFRVDNLVCRDYAQQEIGGPSSTQSANQSGVQSAVVGTVIGALIGAAVGNHRSAAAGAGAGLVIGSAVGAGSAQQNAQTLQQRYDNAYIQCMYAKGHRVPVSGRYINNESPAPQNPPPPPPPGSPPPPPPR